MNFIQLKIIICRLQLINYFLSGWKMFEQSFNFGLSLINLFNFFNVFFHCLVFGHLTEASPGVPLCFVDHVPEGRFGQAARTQGGLFVVGVKQEHHLVWRLIGTWKWPTNLLQFTFEITVQMSICLSVFFLFLSFCFRSLHLSFNLNMLSVVYLPVFHLRFLCIPCTQTYTF